VTVLTKWRNLEMPLLQRETSFGFHTTHLLGKFIQLLNSSDLNLVITVWGRGCCNTVYCDNQKCGVIWVLLAWVPNCIYDMIVVLGHLQHHNGSSGVESRKLDSKLYRLFRKLFRCLPVNISSWESCVPRYS